MWVLELRDTLRWAPIQPDAQGFCLQRAFYGAIYSPALDALVVDGGYPCQFPRTASLSLAEPRYWNAICCWYEFEPGGKALHTAVYDPIRDRMIISGGSIYSRCRSSVYGLWAIDWGRPVRWVGVDVRPGSEDDTLHPGPGVLPVGLLSRPDIAATSIDPPTLRLSGASPRLALDGRPQVEERDLDRDGLVDLLVDFEAGEIQLDPGDTTVSVSGQATGGVTIRGTGRLRVVGASGPRDESGTTSRLALHRAWIAPGARGIRVALSLDRPGEARIELLDLAGRRLGARTLVGLGAGDHEVDLDVRTLL